MKPFPLLEKFGLQSAVIYSYLIFPLLVLFVFCGGTFVSFSMFKSSSYVGELLIILTLVATSLMVKANFWMHKSIILHKSKIGI